MFWKANFEIQSELKKYIDGKGYLFIYVFVAKLLQAYFIRPFELKVLTHTYLLTYTFFLFTVEVKIVHFHLCDGRT